MAVGRQRDRTRSQRRPRTPGPGSWRSSRTQDSSADGLRRVVHHRRTSTHHLDGVDHRVPVEAIPDLLTALLATPDRPLRDWPTVVGDAPPEVLVCGHGRRDPCCGRWGTLLHADLAARGAGARLWRCSHTGGHRFAPTAITLPDGRAWAYADADLLDGVLGAHGRRQLARRARPRLHRASIRGPRSWSERSSPSTAGRGSTGEVTSARTAVDDDQRSATVELEWRLADGTTGRSRGEVAVTRTLPVLVCGEPPERGQEDERRAGPAIAAGRRG